jgi:hypothetical protein
VLFERVITGWDVTRGFEGQTQVKETVGNEAACVSFMTTAAGRGDPAHAETNELTVSGVGLRLIARDLQSAGVGPETAGAMGRGRHGTRGGAQRCGIVPGFEGREREIREETMLRIRLRGHIRSRSTESQRGRPPVV